VGFVLVGLAVAVTLGLASSGVYQDDDLSHYLRAKRSMGDVTQLLHRWNRPGYNIPTMLVANAFGLTGCRLFSAIQTAVAALAAYGIARRLIGPCRYAALAPAVLWAQPMVLRLATTTLTETTALMTLTVGLWLWVSRRRVGACAVISLSFVTREELLALLPLVAVGAIWHAWVQADRRLGATLRTGWLWGCAAALLWAPAAYWLSAWLVDLPADASPLTIFSRQWSPEYGTGSWFWFLGVWMETASIGILAVALGGAVALGRRGAMVTAWVWGLVGLHTLIYARVMFASGGYARFLVPVSGLLAVLAAAGLRAILQHRQRPALLAALLGGACWSLLAIRMLWFIPTGYAVLPGWLTPALLALGVVFLLTGLAVLFRPRRVVLQTAGIVSVALSGVLLVGHVAMVIRPLRWTDMPDGRLIVRTIDHLNEAGLGGAPAISQHVIVQHLWGAREVGGNAQAIDAWQGAAPGTLFFWESKYCFKPHEPVSTADLQRILHQRGRVIYRDREGDCKMIVFRRREEP
jgi:hypothetical protein